jgi:hypothetical protein
VRTAAGCCCLYRWWGAVLGQCSDESGSCACELVHAEALHLHVLVMSSVDNIFRLLLWGTGCSTNLCCCVAAAGRTSLLWSKLCSGWIHWLPTLSRTA